jgi:hypothetical protein
MSRNATGFWGGAFALALGLASVARADPQGLIAQLQADLASHASATEVLQRWCADRQLAEPPEIVAERKPGRDRPASAEVRRLLRAGPDEPIRYRRVALACGRHVLSRADNWYRPGQLTAAMNAELDGSDHPFGAVVRPLDFHRQTLSSDLLAQPAAPRIPAQIIRNKALLETPDGTPFSLVVETYSRSILSKGGHTPRPRTPRAPRPATETVVTVVETPAPHHRHGEHPPRPRSVHPRSDHSRSDHPRHHRDRAPRSPRRERAPRLTRR